MSVGSPSLLEALAQPLCILANLEECRVLLVFEHALVSLILAAAISIMQSLSTNVGIVEMHAVWVLRPGSH